MNMKKNRIGLIIGLICVVLCALFLLKMCAAPGEDVEESGETTAPTFPEITEATDPTEESTEESTEPTEETQELTEPTEENNKVVTGGSTGSPGSNGGSLDEEDEETQPTEPEEVVPAGVAVNPYTEVLSEYPADMTTVKIPAGSTMYYNLFNTNGATLVLKDSDAYVIYNGNTVNPVDGVITLELDGAAKGAPATLVIGSKAKTDKAFPMSLTAPVGAPCNPEEVELLDLLSATLAAGSKNGYSFAWEVPEDGCVTFRYLSVPEGVNADIVLLAGDASASLSANGVKGELLDENGQPVKDEAGNTISITTVSLDVKRGQVLAVQAIALTDKQGTQFPAAQVELTGSFEKTYQLVENKELKAGSNALTHADGQTDFVYRFKASESGKYTITVTGDAQLSWWGTDEVNLTDMTTDKLYDEETKTLTLTLEAGKTSLIGVEGKGSCTVTIQKK